jgi:hypothetical protein
LLRQLESELAAIKAEDDPLASHVFVRGVNIGTSLIRKAETPRDERTAEFQSACELGFRGSFDEWKRLMGAVARW